MRPSASIAIPTRNRETYLRAAVESALAAAGPNDQIVVSDNASTDGTAEYLRSVHDPRLTIVRQAHDLGMVGNWNACLGAARGELFLMLSDDDTLEREAIDALAPPLADPHVAFSYGRARVIDETGAERTLGHIGPARESGASFVHAWFASARTLYPCALMVRRGDLVAVGGFDSAFGPFADVGAWLGIWARDVARTIAFTPAIIASYRVHDAALSASDLQPGIAGATELARRFSAQCGPAAPDGFARIRAHYVASALRRRAGATPFPVIAYLMFLLRHLPLVVRLRAPGPFGRQLVILAAPAAYERRKQRRAAEGGTR